jgi:hypothetical protein
MTSLNSEQLYDVSELRLAVHCITSLNSDQLYNDSEQLYSCSLFRVVIQLVAVQRHYTVDRYSESLYS